MLRRRFLGHVSVSSLAALTALRCGGSEQGPAISSEGGTGGGAPGEGGSPEAATGGAGGAQHLESTRLCPASAKIGGWSNADYLSAAGALWDLAPGNTAFVLFDVTLAPAATANIAGCNQPEKGWELQLDAARNLYFVSREAGGPAPIKLGVARDNVYCVALTRRAGGELVVFFNGGPGAVISPTLAGYVSNDEASVLAVGRNNPAVGANPFQAGNVYAIAHIADELSDVAGRLMTSLTRLDRYHLPPEVTAHAGLVFHLASDRDWNGSAPEIVAGLGNDPPSLTVHGTPALTTVDAELIYDLQKGWLHDSLTYEIEPAQQETEHYRHQSFARLRVHTSATKLVIDFASTLTSTTPNYLGPSVFVDGAFFAEPQPSHYTVDASRDVTLPEGDKLVDFCDGVQAKLGDQLQSVSLMALRVPVTTPLTIIAPTAPAKRLLIVGDSLAQGLMASSAAAEGWAMLTRFDAMPEWQVAIDAWGFRTLKNTCATADDRTSEAARLCALCDGALSNIIWFAVMTNDYGLSAWSAAAYEEALGELFDEIHAQRPDISIYAQTALTRGTESANGAGSTLASYRDAMSSVQAARADFVVLVDGRSLVSFPESFDDDQIHPAASGHAEYYESVKALLDYG